MLNKNELKKLSPAERIKRLRQMGDERKKEVTEIESLIKESDYELKIDKIAEQNAPAQKPVEIADLFKGEGGRLENDVRKERPTEEARGYRAIMQAYEDYASLKKVMNYAASGSFREEHAEAVDRIGERLQRFKYESASEEVANIVVASRAALHKIRRYAGLD
ncbi:hypothetical protein HYX09_06045 [Candidatus Woesearchaeota archaeon]|nr:hypothetical protein [Candidatus Woesearchaeota archaeon]MBI2661795.1 hypothetical protein [Candidatus Woesearchaeota archaeon]